MATGSIPVAGSNVYGCKLRFYLGLQPLSLFYTIGTNQYNFGTSQKISAFKKLMNSEEYDFLRTNERLGDSGLHYELMLILSTTR